MPEPEPDPPDGEAAGLEPTEEPREERYARWLRDRLERYLGRPASVDTPFAEQGLDSVASLSLYGDLEEEFGLLIEPTDIWTYPTVRELSRYLALRDPSPDQDNPVRVGLVFTCQGAQHPGMTSGLYQYSAGYRGFLDEAAEALRPYTALSVVDVIMGCDPRIDQTAYAYPAIFAVEYALARTLQQAGVQPVAVLGHGVGEFAAAVIGGALQLEDAAKLVAMLGAYIQYLPEGGGMLATCASPTEAAELAAGERNVVIGAVNGSRATVLSGALGGLDRIRERLAAQGTAAVPLNVMQAFHSPMMEPVLPRLEKSARRLGGGTSRLPFYSTVRGRMTNEPLYAPYWVEHLTAPVLFAEAARQMLAQQDLTHVVEIGPKAVLIPFLRRLEGSAGPACLAACRGPETNAVALAGVLAALHAGPLSAAHLRAFQ
jgi:acyl transferase domain-containing protein/acyl carrier protein